MVCYIVKKVSESATKYNELGRDKYAIIPMRLKYDSEVTGEISVSEGKVRFSLEDYFGWIPQYQSSGWVKNMSHGRGRATITFRILSNLGIIWLY